MDEGAGFGVVAGEGFGVEDEGFGVVTGVGVVTGDDAGVAFGLGTGIPPWISVSRSNSNDNLFPSLIAIIVPLSSVL